MKEDELMLYPKIGIRPVIDGRWGGIREGFDYNAVTNHPAGAKHNN